MAGNMHFETRKKSLISVVRKSGGKKNCNM